MAPFSRLKYPRTPLDRFGILLPIDDGYIAERKEPSATVLRKIQKLD
jgi:hypothetical protein